MTQLIESVLGGGGEMGERMRGFNWSKTALGPVEQWPQALRISVRIMLGAGYPMAIGWGPDYTLLYNDAQRVLFGTKDAAALGRRTRDVFPETWVEPDVLDPSVIDCTSQNPWGFDTALASEGIVVELGQRVSALPTTGTVRWTELTPPEWRERDHDAMAALDTCSTVQPYEKEFFGRMVAASRAGGRCAVRGRGERGRGIRT